MCAEFQEGFSSCCRQEGCCIRSMMSTSLQLLHAVVCCVVSCIQTQLECTLLRANDQNAAACWSWARRQHRVFRSDSRRIGVFLARHWPAGSKELCAEFQEGFSSCCRQEGCCIRSMMSTSLQLLHTLVCCVVSCIQTQLGCNLLRANDQNAAAFWSLASRQQRVVRFKPMTKMPHGRYESFL